MYSIRIGFPSRLSDKPAEDLPPPPLHGLFRFLAPLCEESTFDLTERGKPEAPGRPSQARRLCETDRF